MRLLSGSVEWVDPANIRFKISPHHDLVGVRSGNWDVDRRINLFQAVKYRSIFQRYEDGRDWAETDLFKDIYSRRILHEGIRGVATLQELIEQYETRVDDMFQDLKINGFKADRALPKLLIGRTGEVFIGNQGNHRLAMAHVLGLKEFAGEVLCRHKQTQLNAA